MGKTNIFISVAQPCNIEQQNFIDAFFQILKEYDLNPCAIGITYYSSDTPLNSIIKLMNNCNATIVIAFERIYLSNGKEKRGGPKEKDLRNQKIPSVWNQIEATMAYMLHLPIFVIAEEGIRQEGLLEECYDWRVLSVPLNKDYLNSEEFRGVIKSWAEKVHKISNDRYQ